MELIVLLLLVGVLFGLEDRLYVRQWARGLHYECRFSTDEAYEGDEITLIETITNGKALPLAWAKAEITASRWLAFAGSQSTIAGDTRFVPSFGAIIAWCAAGRCAACAAGCIILTKR